MDERWSEKKRKKFLDKRMKKIVHETKDKRRKSFVLSRLFSGTHTIVFTVSFHEDFLSHQASRAVTDDM